MPRLSIRTVGDPVLRQRAQEITEITPSVKRLAANMLETMHLSEGVGLAAPQVGESVRLVVIQLPEEGSEPIFAVNPEILEREGEQVGEEGCLSVPGVYAEVRRARSVLVRFLDLEGEEVVGRAEGLLARAFEHEIDHLDGVLFIDRLTPSQREELAAKIREASGGEEA